MNILFVCTGNTCRSPMAQALFEKMLDEQKIHDIKVKSAGIATVEGSPVTENTVETLKEYSIDLENHTSKLLTEEMCEWAERIYVMTDGHRATMHDLYPKFIDKVKILSDDEDGIEDPYGMPLESYERCAEQICISLVKIINELKNAKKN